MCTARLSQRRTYRTQRRRHRLRNSCYYWYRVCPFHHNRYRIHILVSILYSRTLGHHTLISFLHQLLQSRHILCSRLVKHIGQFFLPVQFTLVRSLIPPTLSLAPPTLPFALPILSLSQTVSLSLQFSPTLISLFLQVTGKFLGIYLRSFNLMKPSLVQPTLPHHCLPVRRLNLPT